MGIYKNMLTDMAVLKTVNGCDENGCPNIIALEEIDCRIEFKHSLSVSSQGQEIACAGRLFTESVVKVGDIIELRDKEFKVVSVAPYYPLGDEVLVVNEVYFS